MMATSRMLGALVLVALVPWSGSAQGPGGQRQMGPGQMGPGQGGPMGGGPNQQERKVVAQFDKDGDKRLNAAERREARVWLESQPQTGPGGRGGRGGMSTGTPGPKIAASQVKKYGSEPLYDPSGLRTFFLDV